MASTDSRNTGSQYVFSHLFSKLSSSNLTNFLYLGEKYEVQLLSVPGKLEITSSSAVLHIRDWQFSLIQGIPPRLIGYWNMADLRLVSTY